MFNENEKAARAIQLAVEGNSTEFAKEISYLVGNATLRGMNLKSDLIQPIIAASASAEGARALGTTAFKAVSDASQGDKICTGLCIVASVCEGTALIAANVKILPYRGKIYIASKSGSIALMRFRNLCRNAKGQIGPC